MYLINHVRDLEGMGRSEKLLLFTMATYAKEDGTNIWPGQLLLMRKCNLCERQIRRLISSLIEKGYLQLEGYRGHTKCYKIPVEKLWPGYTEALKEAKRKRSKHDTPPAPEEQQDIHLLPASSNGYHPAEEPAKELTAEEMRDIEIELLRKAMAKGDRWRKTYPQDPAGKIWIEKGKDARQRLVEMGVPI